MSNHRSPGLPVLWNPWTPPNLKQFVPGEHVGPGGAPLQPLSENEVLLPRSGALTPRGEPQKALEFGAGGHRFTGLCYSV